MGLKSRIKKRNRQIREEAKRIDDGKPPSIPSPFDNCVIQPINCLLKLDEGEPFGTRIDKQYLEDGRMLATLHHFAITPLKEYRTLLAIKKDFDKAVQYQVAHVLREQMAKLRERREKKSDIVVAKTLPPELKQ